MMVFTMSMSTSARATFGLSTSTIHPYSESPTLQKKHSNGFNSRRMLTIQSNKEPSAREQLLQISDSRQLLFGSQSTKEPYQLKNELQCCSSSDKYDMINLTRCDNKNDTIEELLQNPIKCGFLLSFCQKEYSTENMMFLIEIDRFKDSMKADRFGWHPNLSFQSMDAMIENEFHRHISDEEMRSYLNDGHCLSIGKKSLWPSRTIPYESVCHDIQTIWDKFLASNAPYQICMPSKVLINTIHRLKYVHLYGGTIFDETIIDPMKTLTTDTLPRFLSSSIYDMMNHRLKSLLPLPSYNSLELSIPSKAPSARWQDNQITESNIATTPMINVLHDHILYEQFLLYCKRIYSEENILCGRAISLFKCYYMSHTTCPPNAEEMAWKIFRYFIAPGSAYQVSVSYRQKKDIMQQLVNPSENMFDDLQESIHDILRVHWNHFSHDIAFRGIPKLIFDEKLRRQQHISCETHLYDMNKENMINKTNILTNDIGNHHHHRIVSDPSYKNRHAQSQGRRIIRSVKNIVVTSPKEFIIRLFSPRNSPTISSK